MMNKKSPIKKCNAISPNLDLFSLLIVSYSANWFIENLRLTIVNWFSSISALSAKCFTEDYYLYLWLKEQRIQIYIFILLNNF